MFPIQRRRSHPIRGLGEIGLNRKLTLKVVSVLLCALGSIPFLYFFATVDEGTPLFVLLIGVGMISVSGLLSIITVEDDSYNLHFVFFLYFSTLMFFSMYRIRFNNLSYGDVLWEYRTARNTLEQGTWLIQRSGWERYFSSISVSLTPAIVSEITGFDLLLLFLYGYRIVTAILPIALYYLVNDVLKNAKVGAIASVLFSQLYFNIIKLMNLTRQQVSEIFFVLLLLLLFRVAFQGRKNYRSYFILILVFMFSLLSSHYTVNYFSIAIFGAMFFASLFLPYFPKKLAKLIKMEIKQCNKKAVTMQILVLLLVSSLVWWSTVHLANLRTDVTQEINNLFFRKAGETAYQVKFIQSSPLGPIVTVWVDMEAALAAIGFIYLLFRVRKDERMVNWIVGGSVMFAAMALWLTPQQSYTGCEPERIYVIGSIFFSSFVAFILHVLGKHKFLKILFVVFILLNLSMNMFLPVYSEYVHYNKEANVPVEKNVIRESLHDAEFTLQIWMNEHVSTTETVMICFFGGINIFYSHCSVKESSTIILNETTYIILDHSSLLYGLWKSGDLDYEVINVTTILNQSSIVYNNGRAVLISSKE